MAKSLNSPGCTGVSWYPLQVETNLLDVTQKGHTSDMAWGPSRGGPPSSCPLLPPFLLSHWPPVGLARWFSSPWVEVPCWVKT